MKFWRNISFLKKHATDPFCRKAGFTPRHREVGKEAGFTPRHREVGKEAGFTLIEVLLAASLVAFIGIAIYTCLNSGIQTMKRLTRPLAEEDRALFFEKIKQELGNAFPYSSIRFEGNEERFSFPTRVKAPEELGGELGIGEVIYSYHSGENAFMRQQFNLNQVYEDDGDKPVAIMKNILSLRFLYYFYAKEDQQYVWLEEWDPDENEGALPLAVRMEFKIDDGNKQQFITRTISIPVGG